MKVYTVTQINNYIKRLLDEDFFLSGVFIGAEISNYKEHVSGHLYFTLKDEKAAINAVMFRDAAAGLTFRPESGMNVIVSGRVSVYEKTGQYQLYVDLMEPAGLGALYLAFTQLKNKLEAEGLFDVNIKRPIPRFPDIIGVVTAAGGAAIRDIINVAKRRNPAVKLIISPSPVQGQGAAEEIAAAIEALNRRGSVDVIIVGRGGGSIEDLWAFNEEVVARAVRASAIPVVSAVGHETDFTICDFAADLRAPTPSAAAELCVPDRYELKTSLNWIRSRLDNSLSAAFNERETTVMSALARFTAPDNLTGPLIDKNNGLFNRLDREMTYRLENIDNRCGGVIQAFHSAAPLNVLKRGFSLIHIDGKPIKSAAEAGYAVGRVMSARMSDGEIHGEITGVTLLS